MTELNRDRWENLCAGAGQGINHWYDQLVQLYAEPHRHYHNGRHIADCLAELDSTRDAAREPQAVEFALWFHDAIYDPRAADNEERSADLARQFICETKSANLSENVITQLILATKHHDASLHRDAALIVDIDLSIFGQAPERFWQYEQQIRQEYGWVPENIFNPKRAEILERFLARPKIFTTESFFRKYEARARANLTESIRRLRDWKT